MRVLGVINALGEGGTEKSYAELIPHLEKRGIEVRLVTLRSRGAEGVEHGLRERGTEITLLPSGPRRVVEYRRVLREVRPDVVHSMLFEANMLARLGGVGGPPVLTSLVNTSYSPERVNTPGTTSPGKLAIVRIVDSWTGRLFVARFHAVSDAVKDDAVEHLHLRPSRVTVIRRGRNDPRRAVTDGARDRVRTELGIPPDATVVVNVARHEHQKDHRTLLRAVAPLLPVDERLWLLIAGRHGPASDAIDAELRTMEASDRVLLLGHRADVPDVLTASDVFALSSRYEGLPGALLEAMGIGLPAVASDIGPVREVAEPEQSALLADAGDPGSFRSALGRLVDDPTLRASLGNRSRQIFDERFRIEDSADKLASLYHDVAEARPARRRSR